jgi:hypothetical protein
LKKFIILTTAASGIRLGLSDTIVEGAAAQEQSQPNLVLFGTVISEVEI